MHTRIYVQYKILLGLNLTFLLDRFNAVRLNSVSTNLMLKEMAKGMKDNATQ